MTDATRYLEPLAPPSSLAALAPDLLEAADSFIRHNSNFESSIVQQRVVANVGAASDAMHAFAIPIQEAILTMDSALRWLMFWWTAIENKETGDLPVDDFTINGAMTIISQVYDIAYQDQILQHFEVESDDEGDDSDTDDEDDKDDELDAGARLGAETDPFVELSGVEFGGATPDMLLPASEEL